LPVDHQSLINQVKQSHKSSCPSSNHQSNQAMNSQAIACIGFQSIDQFNQSMFPAINSIHFPVNQSIDQFNQSMFPAINSIHFPVNQSIDVPGNQFNPFSCQSINRCSRQSINTIHFPVNQ
jgi:hypothetical protein